MNCWQFLTSSCFRALLHLRDFLWVIPFLTQMQMFVIVQRPRCQDGSFTLEAICGGCFFMVKGRIIKQMRPNFLYYLTNSHVQIMHRQLWYNIGPGFTNHPECSTFCQSSSSESLCDFLQCRVLIGSSLNQPGNLKQVHIFHFGWFEMTWRWYRATLQQFLCFLGQDRGWGCK